MLYSFHYPLEHVCHLKDTSRPQSQDGIQAQTKTLRQT